jgi:hypothetical protein
MKSVVRPELSTAAAGPSQAPTAAVDNSALVSTHPEPTYKSGEAVQTTGTTSPARGAIIELCALSRFERPAPVVTDYDRLLGWEVAP